MSTAQEQPAPRFPFAWPNGTDLIDGERRRQTNVLGYTEEHDLHHGSDALLSAARAYLNNDPAAWPFEPDGFRPSTPLRDAVKGGALALAAAAVAPTHGEWEVARSVYAQAGEAADALLKPTYDVLAAYDPDLQKRRLLVLLNAQQIAQAGTGGWRVDCTVDDLADALAAPRAPRDPS